MILTHDFSRGLKIHYKLLTVSTVYMQKTNIFLFTAFESEVKPILNLSTMISETIFNNIKIRTFDFDNRKINVLITGMGKKKTQKILSAVADFIGNGMIINIGTAGALNNKFQIGDWFSVNKVFSDDKVIEIENCSVFHTASILTSDSEITNEEIKQKHHKKYSADLVDMESFYIAEFAKQKNILCRIIKMVSDHANESTNSISALKGTMKIHYNPHAAESFLEVISA